MEKSYLGDSVYATFDGFHITLTTENGMGASNIIHLEDKVVYALIGYIENSYKIKLPITKEDVKPKA